MLALGRIAAQLPQDSWRKHSSGRLWYSVLNERGLNGAWEHALQLSPLVCCRWNSRRIPLSSGPSYLPSSTCYHSASQQHPCSAANGLWAHRRCPSPCAGKVWQPNALTCRCPWMGSSPTHPPRRWYNTPGRLGMTGSPSLPSAVACGYPVRKPWKSQVISSHQLHGLVCFFFFLIAFLFGPCMGVYGGMHIHEEVRGQCAGIHSLPRGSTSASQAWRAWTFTHWAISFVCL